MRGIGVSGVVGVVEVGIDGAPDGSTPGVGLEGVAIFVFGDADGLDQDLAEEGEGGGGFAFDLTLSSGGEDASEGDAEIAGGEVMTGEEVRDVVAEILGGAGLGFFAGVEETER